MSAASSVAPAEKMNINNKMLAGRRLSRLSRFGRVSSRSGTGSDGVTVGPIFRGGCLALSPVAS